MVIVWGPDERARAREILEYAKTHPYRPDVEKTPPGAKEEHVMWLPFGVRIVYSVTILPDHPPYRHLSLSMPETPKRLPTPAVVTVIATDLFEFEPPAARWDMGFPEPDAPLAIVSIAQPLEEA